MANVEGKKSKGSQSGGLRRRSGSHQTLRTPTIQRQPGAAVTLRGWLYKQGSDGLMLWKKRWFVLSQYCLFYYQGPEEEKVLGSIVLPSYRIIPCGSEDKVYRKYSFKAEHHNTRTYYFAAESKESMTQWMNALSLAAILIEDNTDLTIRPSSRDRTISKGSAVKYADVHPLNSSFDSTLSSSDKAQRQPVYANAPPKPRRLNTSAEYSSSPDTTQPIMLPTKETYARNGGGASPALVAQVMYNAERRTPDAYGRFKADYEDVYNNGSCSSGSSRTHSGAATVANYPQTPYANATGTVGRISRPQSADFLSVNRSKEARKSLQHPEQPQQLQQQQQQQQQQQRPVKAAGSFWSEENYAQQLRQASLLKSYPATPPQHSAASMPRVARQDEISRDVKESALWSYVQQNAKKSLSSRLASANNSGMSNSQENLVDETPPSTNNFSRSASARFPRSRQNPDVLNSSVASGDHRGFQELKSVEQREESMKRLLEWKQRMLQSPLTRKSGNRSGSERNTPTPQSLDSPLMQRRREPLRSPESYQTLTIPARREQQGPGETRRPLQSPASAPLYCNITQSTEQLVTPLPKPVLPDSACPETPKSSKVKLNEADVRKEFTYEYVNDPSGSSGTSGTSGHPQRTPEPVWPANRSTLMREKSSAMQDLRARSESPSANKVLGREASALPPPKDLLPPVPKVRPKPPPKPADLKLWDLPKEPEKEPQDRTSLAESLPESLAGFAETIISEGSTSLPEVTVSPMPSESCWAAFHPEAKAEILYMNTTPQKDFPTAVEDHYLPMTSAKTSVLSASSTGIQFAGFGSNPEPEENTYVEMNDGDPSRKKSQPEVKSVFAGILHPSYQLPESPRYSEISDKSEEQPHYEFIYKASAHHYEPVYMEVPQDNEDSGSFLETNPEAPEVPEANTSLISSRSSVELSAEALEKKNGNPPDLDLLVPPRHPRFSLSDTFRPASYFLSTGRKKTLPLETILATEETEAEETTAGNGMEASGVESFIARIHSRSQSLDETRPGSSNSRRVSLPGSPATRSRILESSKRRPLTEVKSLEDLLSDETLAEENLEAEHSASESQPLYENVSPAGVNRATSGSQAALIASPDSQLAGARLTNNASAATLSSLSLASSASASSVTRSEHSGAPYYYSDLLPGHKGATQGVVAGSGRDSSLRGRLYNKHGERLRAMTSRETEREAARQMSPVMSRGITLSSRPPSGMGRSQTPDLLNNCLSATSTVSRSVSRNAGNAGGEVMRRVRSLEGLLDDESSNNADVTRSVASPLTAPPRATFTLTETPRYARDPTLRATPKKPPESRSTETSPPGDMSPWDEDRLWREKLRCASLRHTRSLDMLDDSQETRPRREGISGEDSERYERLLQYSATLERSKRGQTYLDGYVWDEVAQRFRKADDNPQTTNNHQAKRFLDERLPPAFEIDREKLRQWDLMSSAPIPDGSAVAATGKGGRRIAANLGDNHSQSNAQVSQGNDAVRINASTPAVSLMSPNGVANRVAGAGTSSPEVVGGKSSGLNGTMRRDGTQTLERNARLPQQVAIRADESENSDSDVPLRKGKLPVMVGHNRGAGNGQQLPLSAGDLLGRTHEELVLLLIQLRRQSSALIKARDACILEMESQVKVASLDIGHRQECLAKVGDLKRHVKELEKQMEKLKPLVNLVDNMVKLGSLYPNEKRSANTEAATRARVEAKSSSPVYSNIGQYSTLPQSPQRQIEYQGEWRRNQSLESHYAYIESQRDQLELKRQQLSRLERFVQEEGGAIQKLTQNENILKLALRGVREQTTAALRTGNYGELEHCRQQQDYLEHELSSVHSMLAQSSKRLEDKAVEISQIEQEISILHQQLHRVGRNSTLRSSGWQTHSQSGRELSWLEAELNRVQQHVSQLQTRRQELTSQVTRLTDPHIPSKTPAASWYETDLDTQMRTQDPDPVLQMWDISEADDRMKRYYGIIPKEKPAEIRTVRLVKREAGKRKYRKPEDPSFDSQDDLMDESIGSTVTEEEGYHTSSQDPDDPIMTDPVLSQFSHVLTLPRRRDTKDKRLSNPELNKSPLRMPRRPASSLSLTDPRPASQAQVRDGGSPESNGPSPILTPVYTSDAAREIIEEMRRKEMLENRRSVPRHKRRHLTVSCSQPLAPLMVSSQLRARDDLDMERALRFQHPLAPDVVRSTIGRPPRITDKTIDKILAAPDKILIPERYVPEQEVEEPNEEERQKRLQKTESIRRMLAGSRPVELPRPPTEGGSSGETLRPSEAKQLLANEKRQRDHFISLNRVLAEEMKEKSKMVAARSVSMERLTVAPNPV